VLTYCTRQLVMPPFVALAMSEPSGAICDDTADGRDEMSYSSRNDAVAK